MGGVQLAVYREEAREKGKQGIMGTVVLFDEGKQVDENGRVFFGRGLFVVTRMCIPVEV